MDDDPTIQTPPDEQREVEIDASYAAYDRLPLDEPDEWGDLVSFRAAAAAT